MCQFRIASLAICTSRAENDMGASSSRNNDKGNTSPHNDHDSGNAITTTPLHATTWSIVWALGPFFAHTFVSDTAHEKEAHWGGLQPWIEGKEAHWGGMQPWIEGKRGSLGRLAAVDRGKSGVDGWETAGKQRRCPAK
jgi:hypothetical protein